jgi:hypothetical protein
MRNILFILSVTLIAACGSEVKQEALTPDTDTTITDHAVADTGAVLSEEFITGTWKLVWVTGDSLKISPKMKKKIMNAVVMFHFNSDKNLIIMRNDKKTEATWKIENGLLCIRIKNSETDRCTPIQILEDNKFSFEFEYKKELEAEFTLSRVSK